MKGKLRVEFKLFFKYHTNNVFIISNPMKFQNPLRKNYLLFTILLLVTLRLAVCESDQKSEPAKHIGTFEELAEYHCEEFPLQMVYRLASGRLSEKYGKAYAEVDCYIRQFVNKDGQDKFQEEEQSDEEGEIQAIEEDVPQIDPLVQRYAKGLTKCLPEGANSVEAVYNIWRFYRFVVQHDYTLEWMRAKIRSGLGYQAEKPSTWMDGEQNAPRLRLDKLFSNQFYDYVDTLMFKDFLHPIVTFLKKNVVSAAFGPLTSNGNPILAQYIQTKNLHGEIFKPIIFKDSKIGEIFTYTLPGIPLFLGGSNANVAWAFTGVLVDRSNIEQIQTVGNKFFHHGSEQWIKLQNITLNIDVLGQEQPKICSFIHSAYGTLYEKHTADGKVSQYIARWHQDQRKVRVIFSELYDLIKNSGQTQRNLQFPFNSLVIVNTSGIFNLICFQAHPSYFLYPDLAGAPESSRQRWVGGGKKNFLIVANTQLSTINQQSYLKREAHNPTEQQFSIDIRRLASTKGKITFEDFHEFVHSLKTDPLIKKRKELLIHIYRKAKFLFFPEESMRKQCDQLIAMLQRWNDNLNSATISPIFILWDYYFREYTFNHVSATKQGANVAKHKAVSDVYWTSQMDLWKVGTSYGECDSHEWETQYRQKLNGTGHNSTCYFNIMRGINRTREIIRNQQGSIKQPHLKDFTTKKILNIVHANYLGTHQEEAFQNFFSKNLAFTAELGTGRIKYSSTYHENAHEIILNSKNDVEQALLDKFDEEL